MTLGTGIQIEIVGEDENASAVLDAVRDKLGSVSDTLDALPTAFEASNDALAKLETQFKSAGDAFEESNQKLLDVTKKAFEFGGEAQEVKGALNAVFHASAATGERIALVARHMEELIIETQDVTRATDLLAISLQFAERTGLRVEDAVAQLVDTTRGGTQALRSLSARGARLADALDKVRDPALRAKLGVQALQRELKRTPSLVDKATGAIDKVRFSLAEAGLAGSVATGGLLAAGGAVLGLGTAFGAFLGDSVSTYLELSPAMHQETVLLTEAWEKLKFEVGGAVLGYDSAADRVQGITGLIEKATAWVDKNSDAIHNAAMLFLTFGDIGIKVLTVMISGGLTPLLATIDVVKFAVLGLIAWWGKMFATVARGAEAIGAIDAETRQWFEDIEKGTTDAFADHGLNSWTANVWEAGGAVRDLSSDLKDAVAGVNELGDAARTYGPTLEQLGFYEKNQTKKKSGGGKKKSGPSKELLDAAGQMQGLMGFVPSQEQLDHAAALKKQDDRNFIESAGIESEIASGSSTERTLDYLEEYDFGPVSKDLKTIEKNLKAIEKVGEDMKATMNDALGFIILGEAIDGLQQIGLTAAESFGMMAAGAMTAKDAFGVLLDSAADFVIDFAPILFTTGLGLLGIQTGAPFIAMAAARLLGGMIRGFGKKGSRSSTPTSAAAGASFSDRNRNANQADTPTMLNIELNVGGAALRKEFIDWVVDAGDQRRTQSRGRRRG